MAPGFLRGQIGFWGMVGVVMTALKLKDHMDDYHQVPTEEDGLGPVALRSPVQEGAGLPEVLTLDTEIPGAHRPKRKRRDCCVCCGMRCGLFWKAFGIVCLIFLVWQSIKLIFWAVTPSPTGLEGMPEFSKSLGCIDAPYIYNPEQTIYSVPIGLDKSDHTLDFGRTQAVGTIIIADGAPDATDIQLEMILRTNDESLLESVDLHIPEGISDDGTASIVRLTTPAIDSSSCMRYDVVLRVPTQLKKLAIKTRGIAQIKFAPEAQVSLNTLFVTMFGTTEHDMILPHANIRADELHLQMNRGWLVGEVSLVEKTVINTQNGDAVSNIHVLPVPLQAEGEKPAQAEFETTTGSGRSDFFYVTDRGAPHRPISSMHIASRNGDLYLTYKEAEFSGQVDLQAKSYSSTGVQGTFGHKEGEELPWVGDANGGDKLVAKSNKGWIGLYF